MPHTAFDGPKRIVLPTILFYIVLQGNYFINRPCSNVRVFDQNTCVTCDKIATVVFRAQSQLWFSNGFGCDDIVSPLSFFRLSPAREGCCSRTSTGPTVWPCYASAAVLQLHSLPDWKSWMLSERYWPIFVLCRMSGFKPYNVWRS